MVTSEKKKRIDRDKLKGSSQLYMMMSIPLLFIILFNYIPIFGNIIAFQDYMPGDPWLIGADWVGLENFIRFWEGPYFWQLLRNTFLLSFYSLLFGFPAPIILALALNEVRIKWFKSTVQTITYLPHFIATVVLCGIIIDFTASDGLFNMIRDAMGLEPILYLNESEYFRTIYVASGIWQSIGWSSIIYLATLSSANPSLYEAAEMDGASRVKQMWYVSIPAIRTVIITLLILAVGGMMSSAMDKILLLYRPVTYEVADVFSTYVYRMTFDSNFPQYSFSTAVDLFNSIVNVTLLVIANIIARKVSDGEQGLF